MTTRTEDLTLIPAQAAYRVLWDIAEPESGGTRRIKGADLIARYAAKLGRPEEQARAILRKLTRKNGWINQCLKLEDLRLLKEPETLPKGSSAASDDEDDASPSNPPPDPDANPPAPDDTVEEPAPEHRRVVYLTPVERALMDEALLQIGKHPSGPWFVRRSPVIDLTKFIEIHAFHVFVVAIEQMVKSGLLVECPQAEGRYWLALHPRCLRIVPIENHPVYKVKPERLEQIRDLQATFRPKTDRCYQELVVWMEERDIKASSLYPLIVNFRPHANGANGIGVIYTETSRGYYWVSMPGLETVAFSTTEGSSHVVWEDPPDRPKKLATPPPAKPVPVDAFLVRLDQKIAETEQRAKERADRRAELERVIAEAGQVDDELDDLRRLRKLYLDLSPAPAPDA